MPSGFSAHDATRSPVGGAANEAGSELRAAVGALLASCVIRGDALADVGLDVAAIPLSLEAESDEPVDDLVAELADSRQLLVQVKLSAGLTTTAHAPLDEAMSQFAAALNGGGDNVDRILVLACAEASRDLRRAGRVLERRRLARAGGLTQPERSALERLVKAARRHLEVDRVGALLDALHIWPTDPTRGDGRGMLIARLDGEVAESGHGAEAMRSLESTVRRLARLRGGSDADGLLRALAADRVPLREEAARGTAVARAEALASHRRYLAQRGSTLRLLGVAGSLADLAFADADADVRVDVPEDEERSGRKLHLAHRRRGRTLLTGRAGGGKSTALRALAAHRAARPALPVPLSVDLKALAREGPPTTRNVLAAATSHLDRFAADRLSDAIAHELRHGRCLVLLDGLDEVRRGRRRFAADLGEWIGALHPDVEVLLTTRPAAAEEAAALGLRPITLRPPGHPDTTVHAILDAVATDRLGSSERSAWIEEREDWVRAAIDRDGQLAATPLSVVHLTLAAARASVVSDLPTTRAAILRRTLLDAIEEWEVEQRHRGELPLNPLSGERARAALRQTLFVLGSGALETSPPARPAAVADVAARLAAHHELKPGDAHAAAAEAVAVWEDSGIFTFDGGILETTVRPFAEVSAAWAAAEADAATRASWVASARDPAGGWVVLSLAAALDDDLAAEWASSVARGGTADELVALVDALSDGAAFSEVQLAKVAMIADRLLAADGDAERVAEALIALPLNEDTRAPLRERLLAAVSPDRRALVEALIVTQWDERGTQADAALRAVLAMPEPKPKRPRAEPGVFVVPQRDVGFRRALTGAALRLAAASREDAERVTDRVTDGSIGFVTRLARVLDAAGHDDLAKRVRDLVRFTPPTWGQDWDFDAAERLLLTCAAALGEPRALTGTQRMRLDDLVDLWATIDANWIYPNWPTKHPDVVRGWIEAAATLGGFNRSVLAAQAELVLADLDAGDDTEDLLFDAGSCRPLDRWGSCLDAEAMLDALVECLGTAPHNVATTIGRAILSAPRALDPAARLDRRLRVLRLWSRWYAAGLVLASLDEREALERAGVWIADADPLLRATAAELYSARFCVGGPADDLLRALSDDDEEVRDAALSHLEDAARREDLVDALRALRDGERRPWLCRICGANNIASVGTSCGSCQTVGPEVVRHVDEILGTQRTLRLAPPNVERRIRGGSTMSLGGQRHRRRLGAQDLE